MGGCFDYLLHIHALVCSSLAYIMYIGSAYVQHLKNYTPLLIALLKVHEWISLLRL